MSNRDRLFWLIWLIVAVMAIFWAVKSIGSEFPTQGSGAHALLDPSPRPPPIPKDLIPSDTKYFYFGATATDKQNRVSDYSNEAVFARTNSATVVTLQWDPSPVTNVITNYTVWWGRQTKVYTNSVSAGTNLTADVRIVPILPSNLVVSVTTSNATDLQWSPSLKGPWSGFGRPSWTATNPIGPRYFRATAPSGKPKVTISTRWQ